MVILGRIILERKGCGQLQRESTGSIKRASRGEGGNGWGRAVKIFFPPQSVSQVKVYFALTTAVDCREFSTRCRRMRKIVKTSIRAIAGKFWEI